MMGNRHGWKEARGLLTALARDARANTLVLMAMALIPLAGMVGGGVDISRMYIVKTRLQHACDAGALAGRKSMGGGTWSQSNNMPKTNAEKFFDANYNNQAYGVTSVQRAFTENAGKVSGSAEAVLPMTLMRIFGRRTETLKVTCDAEMRLPNTDVMFVLDTTGSMADPQPGDTVNKITALKTAVKCFYEIVARLDTAAGCKTGTPSGGTGDQVQIRFGFVPYATNVNVGRLLPPGWFADSWMYQTREAVMTSTGFTWAPRGQPQTTNTETLTVSGVAKNQCTTQNAQTAGYNTTSETLSNNGTVKTTLAKTVTSTSWSGTNNNNGTCTGTRVWVETISDKVPSQAFQEWHYARLPVNVGLLKNGSEWNENFLWPVGKDGANKTIRWDGCIEERQTERTTDYTPIPKAAKDLDIDLVPVLGDDSTRWGMVLPDVVYTRKNNNGNWTMDERTTTSDYGNGSIYACPLEARKLQQWPDASKFDEYVNKLGASGNTYHDIGLIWGARLMSPTGLFKAENEFTPKGGEIERHLIFMTDGDACTAAENYTAYGVAWYDRRQTSESAVPTEGCTSNGYTLTEQVNLRTEALCQAIQNKNITLWVVAFGNLATSTETRLKECATPGKYFKATSAEALQNTFKSIADQISQLRLTK
jgi:Flp pilus assembly protein TadG